MIIVPRAPLSCGSFRSERRAPGRTWAAALLPLFLLAAPLTGQGVAATDAPGEPASPERLYEAACASCHGADGHGADLAAVQLDVPLPDFTECSFATREPDADWAAVVHAGGPVRGFDRMMPAFGDALTDEEVDRVLTYVRSFCGDEWPRGELNLPRPLVTEKAYPEDEAVWTGTTDLEGAGAFSHELVYERRFGARNQLEIVVPFGWRERIREGAPGEASDWTGGIGDVAVGVKRDVFHRFETGTIVSVTGEVILPTGDEDDGFGNGTTVFEPFVSVGQLLPSAFFVHGQAGLELPADADRAEQEGFWRLALGRTFTTGRWGRAWSPMVELLGFRELTAGEPVHWDLLPQIQVTLNTRQHVMANVGVRVPLDDAGRDAQLLVYLLWDWFDGGLFAGW